MNVNTSNPFLKAKKQDYLVGIFGIILVFIVLFLITAIVGNNNNTKKNQATSSSSAPLPITQTNNGVVIYDPQKQNELYQKLQTPQTISEADNKVKTKLLNSLGNETGMLYESNNVAISYIKSVDLFQAEILSLNVQSAKEEANAWFTNQGMSHQGMCNLPVLFFLNAAVADQLHNNNLLFSPLPNGC